MRERELGLRFVGTLALLVVVAAVAASGTAAAQSVDGVRTTLEDTDGDGLDDRVEVNVSVTGAARTRVVLNATGFGVDPSPTDTSQEDIVQTDGNAVQFDSLGGADTTYTVVAGLSGQEDGETGTVEVDVDEGQDTDSTTYTVTGTGDGGSEGAGRSGDSGDGSEDGGSGTDGSAGDGDTTEGGGNASEDNGGQDDGGDDSGEGTPGFTVVAAIAALVAAGYRTRRR